MHYAGVGHSQLLTQMGHSASSSYRDQFEDPGGPSSLVFMSQIVLESILADEILNIRSSVFSTVHHSPAALC